MKLIGAQLCDLDKNKVVLINAEGKKHAIAVGLTLMSTDEM